MQIYVVFQAKQIDRRVGGSKFEVPSASFVTVSMMAVTIFLPIYDRIIVPTLRRITKNDFRSSLEAMVYLHTSDPGLSARLLAMCSSDHDADNLHRLFITSQAKILSSASHKPPDVTHSADCVIQENNEVWIGVVKADGLKCERCFHYTPKVGSYPEHPTLCSRCYDVVAAKTQPAVAAVS
ncbi:hypothetical protein Droror1_Dr00008557 [Drosera rotundifolia]